MLLDLLQQAGLPADTHGNFAPTLTSLHEELSLTEILTSCSLPDTSSTLSLLHILQEGLPDSMAHVANVDTELYVPPLCRQGSCKDQLAEIYAHETCTARSDTSGADTILAWPLQSPFNQRGNEATKPSTSPATSNPSSTLENMDASEFHGVQDCWHRQSSHRSIKDASAQHSCQTSLDEGSSLYMQESLQPLYCVPNMGADDACRTSSQYACGAADKSCSLDNYHTARKVDDCTIAVSHRPTAARKRKRSRSSCKNSEEVESQRMTHIAVERNRRKQMNEHLHALRSLMPATYIQRGDQASIIGGAIDFVKELEHVLQALKTEQRKQGHIISKQEGGSSALIEEAAKVKQQVSMYQMQQGNKSSSFSSNQKATHVACEGVDVDVRLMMNGSSALVKVLAQKLPHQLWEAALSIESFHLKIMHLNVTTIDKSVLYSFHLEVLGDSQLQSATQIAQLVQNIFRIQK